MKVQRPNPWLSPAVCIFLALAVWAVFGQTLWFGFVNYDDNSYVYENAVVCQGLTLKGIISSFAHSDLYLWTPVTRLSHMLDCQLYGLQPWGHHLSNVVLHAATSILLFVVLRQMTAALWRSAFVAAVFAIHPLHVESVAWVSERKDALSGLFFMLTLWAYVRYVQNPRSLARYLRVICPFALGLMSKPMLVTLPFVLLLLDYWPLKRIADGWRLLVEKLPLLALSCTSVWLALFDPFSWNGPSPGLVVHPSLPLRVSNAIVSYGFYIWQMVYPAGLGVRYPFPMKGVPLLQVALSMALLASISAGVCFARFTRPYLLVGWLWYLGMLVPVIQVVQLGGEARCDRYTYLPQIGLYILLAWGGVELCGSCRHRRAVSGSVAAAILAGLMVCAHVQAGYWKNSISLWTHTLACTSGNTLAHNNLGVALCTDGNVDQAIPHYEQALQLDPAYPDAHYNLGKALVEKGKLDEAIQHYDRVIEIKPGAADAHNNLGIALARQGKLEEAVHHFNRALQLKPHSADTHINLGRALGLQRKLDEAIQQYEQALQLSPGSAEAHTNLGMILLQKGRVDEAIAHYRKALEVTPGSAQSCNNLAWVLATHPMESVRNGARALELAQRADRLSGGKDPMILDTLAAAHAEAGQFDEAVQTAQRAIALATKLDNSGLADGIRERLQLHYQLSKPFHEPVPITTP